MDNSRVYRVGKKSAVAERVQLFGPDWKSLGYEPPRITDADRVELDQLFDRLVREGRIRVIDNPNSPGGKAYAIPGTRRG